MKTNLNEILRNPLFSRVYILRIIAGITIFAVMFVGGASNPINSTPSSLQNHNKKNSRCAIMEEKHAWSYSNSKNDGIKILMTVITALLLFIILAVSAGAQNDRGSISGFKINDTNHNGKWDAGETSIPGWHIRLIGIAGTGLEIKVIRKETFTDAQGFYKFDDLPAGRYIVIESIQRGWISTNSIVKHVKLTDGDRSINVNFTNRLLRVKPTPTPTPTPTPPHGAPDIIIFSPPSPVSDVTGNSRTFSIAVNQTVDVFWYINGTQVFKQAGITESTYANTSGAKGTWNVTAIASNANGTVSQEWIWIVAAAPVPARPPSIEIFTPSSPVSDFVGAIRTFSITLNQMVNVTWYINGTQVQFNESTAIAGYTNTSAAAGTWNVTVTGSNSNGTASQIWTWIVNVINYTPGSLTNLANTTGNFYVNHTWIAGADTDSFNVSVNGTWHNSSSALFRNTSSSPHGWVNISVAGYNASSHLLSDFISQDTQIPNNPISITDTQDSYSLNEGQTLYIDANYTDADGDIGTFARNFSQGTFDTSTGILSWTTGAGDAGVYSWQINVTDGYGSISTKKFIVTVAGASTSPPSIISFSPSPSVTNIESETRNFNITLNQTVNVTWYINGIEVFNQGAVTESLYTNTSASAGNWIVNATASNANGTVSQDWLWTVTTSELPPDPVTVAPPVDTTVATDLATATEFLYTGSNPIQTGVAPGTIEARRVVILRGRVLTRDGTNLTGVNISILNHPELGRTLSRADGMFDMAVNGGGYLTVNYEKEGYLTVQRQEQTPWQDYVWLPDVVMIQADTQVTAIDLSSTEPIQVARGSVVNDSDGTRQATLFFPQGIQANMTLPDGTMQPLTNMHVRATEYTVGENGSESMPAELPPTSGYTYAVELSVDEAGSTDVHFDRPVYTYVENFLNFPVGGIVPSGYYNRSIGQWIPSENGRIIKILDITGGLANLDIDGSNQSANVSQLEAFNITDTERKQLATLYQPNQSLWRVPITHFSPRDFNWPYRPDCDPAVQSCAPNQPPPGGPGGSGPKPDNPDNECGSIIGCQNQVLGEAVDIVGTPFSLHYQSDRVPGYKDVNALAIPLSGGSVPASLRGIELEITIAGQFIKKNFSASPNQVYTFTWDGKNAYGRKLYGMWPINVRIGYVYGAVYSTSDQYTASFGGFGDALLPNPTRKVYIFWQEWMGSLSAGNAQSMGMEGWSLDIHHAYDPVGKVLYTGDGKRRSSESLGAVITTVAGNGSMGYEGDGGPAKQANLSRTTGVAVGPDGSLYIADQYNYRIRRVGTDGIISTVAGNGISGYSGDGGSATMANLRNPNGIAVGSDGSLYIAENGRIRRVGPDGIISTVAGNGCDVCDLGDGGPATQAYIRPLGGIAVGPDSSLYIADHGNNRIRHVGTDGIITTVAGNGNSYPYGGDGGPATQATLFEPMGVAVGPDGSLYIADYGNNRIRRVGIDGIITTVAGNGQWGYEGDGRNATEAKLDAPVGISVGPDGGLYIADYNNNRIRRVGTDGIINTVAGNGIFGYSGDDGQAKQAAIEIADPTHIALGPDGSLYIPGMDTYRIRRVALASAGISSGDIFIPSEDGSEVYIFNSKGRHLRTMDALTNAVRYQFGYDSEGHLINITDGDGNVMTIERNAAGNATAFVSPYGDRTTLTQDTNGYLASITNPAGESSKFAYTTEGLLTSMKDSRGNVYNFSYDSLGRLTMDEDPSGGSKTLSRTETSNGYSVMLSTGLNRNTTYQMESLSTGDQRRVNTFPNGLKTETIIGTNGSEINTYPDGTITTLLKGPDPRFGMLAPVPRNISITTPQGLTGTITSERTASLTDPDDIWSLKTLTENFSINGRKFTSTFDAASRNITVLTPARRTGTATLDNKGRIVESQIPSVIPVRYTYDIYGRINTVRQGTRTYTLNYDERGNLENITDPLSRSVSFEYDLAGRVTGQTLPDGRQIGYSYDANGNVVSITPPGRPAHSFNYTAVDLMEEYLPPDIGVSGQTHYTYNIDRELTRVTRPDGASIDLGYDSAGRLSTVNYPQGNTSLSYNASTGNLKEITAPDGGTITYDYDGSLLTDTTWSGSVSGRVHRTYDNNFRLTSESVNSANTVNFQYDPDGLLTNAGELALSRDPQNGILTGSFLGTITDTLGYNSYGELASYQAASSGSVIFAVNYTRDDLGRIVRKNETIDGATHTYDYTYDLAGRLTNVSKDGVIISHYVYDANGNRLSYTGQGGTISGTYDNQDRLLQYGTTTYTYTANGELQSKTMGGLTTTYQHDMIGNLRNVTLPDGTKIEYVIDGNNRRTDKKVNGVIIQGFLYKDELRPVAELDGAGNVISRFVYAGTSNLPGYMISGGVIYRIVTDHLGSPRIVIDIATGTVMQRLDYDEFGKVTLDTNPGFQPFGFAGGLYQSDTKLIRFGARDYDSETGRWTSKDPILFDSGNSNMYGYVINDPVNFIDPLGLYDIVLDGPGVDVEAEKILPSPEGVCVVSAHGDSKGVSVWIGGKKKRLTPYDLSRIIKKNKKCMKAKKIMLISCNTAGPFSYYLASWMEKTVISPVGLVEPMKDGSVELINLDGKWIEHHPGVMFEPDPKNLGIDSMNLGSKIEYSPEIVPPRW